MVHPTEFGYDLRTPCSDCPFRRDVPHHQGIASGLPQLFGAIEQDRALHSCHKTDPKADGFKDDYKGRIQACAGFMVMQARDPNELQWALRVAIKEGLLDLSQLNMRAPVFTPTEMILSYARFASSVLKARELKRAVEAAESEGWPAA